MEQTAGRCPFAAQRETRSGTHPFHLRRSILNREILRPVLDQVGLTVLPDDPHVILAHSLTAVDWARPVFEPNPHRIAVTPRNPRFERRGTADRLFLVFDAPELEARWRQIVEAGASWDQSGFTPSINLGLMPDPLPAICFFAGPILFGPEWRATPDCVNAPGHIPGHALG